MAANGPKRRTAHKRRPRRFRYVGIIRQAGYAKAQPPRIAEGANAVRARHQYGAFPFGKVRDGLRLRHWLGHYSGAYPAFHPRQMTYIHKIEIDFRQATGLESINARAVILFVDRRPLFEINDRKSAL